MPKGIKQGVIWRPATLSRDQVKVVLDLKQTVQSAEAKVYNKDHQEEDKQTRQSKIWWLTEDNAPWLIKHLLKVTQPLNAEFFGADITELEPLQLTEYAASAGGRCRAHIDSSYADPTVAKRKLSLTIQLSDPADYDGGELRLYPDTLDPVIADNSIGSMTLFRSYILHEVTPVTRGVRTSLVAWFSGPDWR